MPSTQTERAAPGRALSRQTMSVQVADDLRRRILSGELSEGLQLKQEQLALEFGISKVPVREALSLLEAEGFVIQQFHRGAVVAGLSPGQLMELFEIRAQLESWLFETAMVKATAADIEVATQAADLIAASNDPAVLPTLNRAFHEALYRPADKTYAQDLVNKMHGQLDRYVRLQFSLLRHQKDLAVDEHAELLRLYTARDPRAGLTMRKHIMSAAEQLASVLDNRSQSAA